MSSNRGKLLSPIGVVAKPGEMPKEHTRRLEQSRNGEVFDVAANIWKLSARFTLNVGILRALVAPALLEGLTMTLCHLSRNKSPSTCDGLFAALKDYSKRIAPEQPITAWRVADLLNYREQLICRFGHEAYLIKVRAFLKTWHDLRHPGVSREVYEVLQEMRLKGPEPGRAVRSMDPTTGPLEPTELHTLAKDIQSTYENGVLTLERFALCLFHIATGRRPIQSADLKCKDLDGDRAPDIGVFNRDLNSEASSTAKLLLIHVPRAKQHGSVFRDEFRSIQCTPDFFSMFRMHQRMVQRELENLLVSHDWHLETKELLALQADLPLFPAWEKVIATLKALASLREEGRHGQALQDLRAAAAMDQWHRSSATITLMLQRAIKLAGSVSRTGELLTITSLRLRWTKGTNLAREGLGKDIIGWLLDHSTMDSVKVYVDNLPEHAIPVNAAMALSPTMRNLASLFRGKVVDTEQDALAGDDPHASRVHFKGKGSATCGTRKQCGMGSRIPLCCYECDHFQPWLEGPHMEVLTELLRERQQRETTLGSDHPVTKVGDSTIVAVVNVIQRCEARRQELQSSSSIGGMNTGQSIRTESHP